MPRYFFHVRRGQLTILDHQGADLVELKDAIKEGERRALEIEEQAPKSNGAIIIDDEFSRMLEVPFGVIPKPMPLPAR